jgi:hypothetical protein
MYQENHFQLNLMVFYIKFYDFWKLLFFIFCLNWRNGNEKWRSLICLFLVIEIAWKLPFLQSRWIRPSDSSI